MSEAPKCGCGCGQRVAWSNRKKDWNPWVKNHHPQKKGKRDVPWNLGNETRYKAKCRTCRTKFESKVKGAQFCSRDCYHRFYSGERSPHWKTGERTTYRAKRVMGKMVREHRLLMAKLIGRRLKKTEVVHHIDEDGMNNALQNLHLFHCDGCHQHFHKAKAPLQYVYAAVHETA